MQPDMTVVAEASNGQQAVELFRQHLPDVTLLDLRMPVMGGVEAANAIRAEFPTGAHDRADHLRRRRRHPPRAGGGRAGVSHQGRAARRAAEGDSRGAWPGQTYLPAAVAAALAAQMPRPDLSAREVQVLELIVRGLANKQIAYALGIAEHTVKNHVKNILSKLGVQDRTQAATAAIQRGIIHL